MSTFEGVSYERWWPRQKDKLNGGKSYKKGKALFSSVNVPVTKIRKTGMSESD